jgi:hypothetical protein
MTDAKDTEYDERGPRFADKDTSTSFSLLRMLVPRSSSSRRGISTCSSNSEHRTPYPTPADTPLLILRKPDGCKIDGLVGLMPGFGKAAGDRSFLATDSSATRAAAEGRSFSSVSATGSMTNMVRSSIHGSCTYSHRSSSD